MKYKKKNVKGNYGSSNRHIGSECLWKWVYLGGSSKTWIFFFFFLWRENGSLFTRKRDLLYQPRWLFLHLWHENIFFTCYTLIASIMSTLRAISPETELPTFTVNATKYNLCMWSCSDLSLCFPSPVFLMQPFVTVFLGQWIWGFSDDIL